MAMGRPRKYSSNSDCSVIPDPDDVPDPDADSDRLTIVSGSTIDLNRSGRDQGPSLGSVTRPGIADNLASLPKENMLHRVGDGHSSKRRKLDPPRQSSPPG